MIDAAAHVEAFNTAVRSGDWDAFAARFADDAVLSFVGPPVGPFRGRAAIAEAYAAQPPADTISVIGDVDVAGDEVVVPYRWDATGATGTMRFTTTGDSITSLTVTFD